MASFPHTSYRSSRLASVILTDSVILDSVLPLLPGTDSMVSLQLELTMGAQVRVTKLTSLKFSNDGNTIVQYEFFCN